MTHLVSSVFHRNLIKEYKRIVSGKGVYLYCHQPCPPPD
jgi:hypothetical protein